MSMPEQFEGLVVVKLGTSTLTNGTQTIDKDYIANLC